MLPMHAVTRRYSDCILFLCSKKQLYKWCTTGHARYTYVRIHKINVNMCKCSCSCIYVVPWDLLFAEHIYTSICYLVNCHVVPTYGMCSYFLHICVRTKTRAVTFTKTTSCGICFGDLFTVVNIHTACAPTSEKYVSGGSLGRTLSQK